MALEIEPLKCIACCTCELACGYYRDEMVSGLSSSIVVYRAEEKRNYFGVMLKTDDSLILGRPEGLEVKKLGQSQGDSAGSAAAKPVLLRPACDLCKNADREEYYCVSLCPTGALYQT